MNVNIEVPTVDVEGYDDQVISPHAKGAMESVGCGEVSCNYETTS